MPPRDKYCYGDNRGWARCPTNAREWANAADRPARVSLAPEGESVNEKLDLNIFFSQTLGNPPKTPLQPP